MSGYFKNVTADDIDAAVSYIQSCLNDYLLETYRRNICSADNWWSHIYFANHPQDIRRFVEEVIQGLNESSFKISLPDEVIWRLSGRSLDELSEYETTLINTKIFNKKQIDDMLTNLKDDINQEDAPQVILLNDLNPMFRVYWVILQLLVEYFAFNAKTFEDLDDCTEACEILIQEPLINLHILHCTITNQIIQLLDPNGNTESLMNNITAHFMRNHMQLILKCNDTPNKLS